MMGAAVSTAAAYVALFVGMTLTRSASTRSPTSGGASLTLSSVAVALTAIGYELRSLPLAIVAVPRLPARCCCRSASTCPPSARGCGGSCRFAARRRTAAARRPARRAARDEHQRDAAEHEQRHRHAAAARRRRRERRRGIRSSSHRSTRIGLLVHHRMRLVDERRRRSGAVAGGNSCPICAATFLPCSRAIAALHRGPDVVLEARVDLLVVGTCRSASR